MDDDQDPQDSPSAPTEPVEVVPDHSDVPVDERGLKPWELPVVLHPPKPHWWRRRGWSFLVFLIILVGMGALALKSARDVSGALPEVGRDAQGSDPWTDPIGVQRAGAFTVARVPDCAAGPIVRIALWDEDSSPYWEVSGPPTPMTSFVVGVTPEGFKEDVKFRAPKPGAVLRLLVIRRLKPAAGVRYKVSDLRATRVKAMLPLRRFTAEGFQTADVCGGEDEDQPKGTTTTTLGP